MTKPATTTRLLAALAALLPTASGFGALAPGVAETFAHSVQSALPPLLVHHSSLLLASSASAAAPTPPLDLDLIGLYRHSLSAHPLTTNVATGACLALLGDAVAQSREPEGHVYDSRRAASFVAFDSCYRAVQFNIFPWIVEHCTGDFFGGLMRGAGSFGSALADRVDPYLLATLERSLSNQLVVVPLFYYPLFFALTGAVQGLTIEGTVDRARTSFLPLMKRNLAFWIPVQFVQFGYVEESLQIPFLCVAGLAWTVILSINAGNVKTKTAAPAAEGGEGVGYCVTGMEDTCVLPPEREDLFDGEGVGAAVGVTFGGAGAAASAGAAAAAVPAEATAGEEKKGEGLVRDVSR